MKRYQFTILVSIIIFGCSKDFLEVKPKLTQKKPSTLADYRAMMDNYIIFINSSNPSMGATIADDFEVPDAFANSLDAIERGSYLWEKGIVGNGADWTYPYRQVFYANIVLDGIESLSDQHEPKEANLIKGTALFWRGLAFFNLLNAFSHNYNKTTARIDLGVPLKLSSDVNDKPRRSSVQEGFDQLIKDLNGAEKLLPEKENYITRPTKVSALALLARVYLTMGDFEQALSYSDKALKENAVLLDYNSLDKSALRPFPLGLKGGNSEILFYTSFFNSIIRSKLSSVSAQLYDQYENGDLRREIFFKDNGKGGHYFKGTYTGNTLCFAGLTTRELYLTRAECNARLGNYKLGMDDLNKLLKSRWNAGFKPKSAHNKDEAVAIILKERRKELVGQYTRYLDLKRLNLEADKAISLQRKYNGEVLELPPNDNRYISLIPETEITLTGIPQNNR